MIPDGVDGLPTADVPDVLRGRRQELDLLHAVVRGGVPYDVAYVHGPSGVGKTALLRAVARRAREDGMHVVWLDAADVRCSLDPLVELVAARAAATVTPGAPDPRPNRVLVLDEVDLLPSLEPWMVRTLVPSLRPMARLLVAGRRGPSRRWYHERVLPLAVLRVPSWRAPELRLTTSAE